MRLDPRTAQTETSVGRVQQFYCPETESKITGERQGASRQGVGNRGAERLARSRKQGSRQAGRDSTTGGWSDRREVGNRQDQCCRLDQELRESSVSRRDDLAETE